MITGTWMEKENYMMHGQSSQDLFLWTKGQTDEETNNPKTRQCMARYVEAYVWCSKKSQAKRRWAIEKPKLDNARQLRGIFLMNQMMKNFNIPWKTLVESWKFRCQQQCLVKTPVNCRGETCHSIGKRKQNQTCLYCRCGWIFENTIGRGTAQVSWRSHRCKRISLSHYNLVHKFIPMPQALKMPVAKAAVEK